LFPLRALNARVGDKTHVTNWSLEGVEGLPEGGVLDMREIGMTDELSMRVRVGRNLTTFPLPGAMTKADRVNFEKTMQAAFDVLIKDEAYGGQVFSMTPNDVWKEVTGDEENPNLITTEKYDELVAAHVMFKDMAADPFLASAGIASDWPCGRGCYQSADGGFIIWFGEEDQLRIMCMAKGFLLNDVFDRLNTVCLRTASAAPIRWLACLAAAPSSPLPPRCQSPTSLRAHPLPYSLGTLHHDHRRSSTSRVLTASTSPPRASMAT
jgi:hypothetical protein